MAVFPSDCKNRGNNFLVYQMLFYLLFCLFVWLICLYVINRTLANTLSTTRDLFTMQTIGWCCVSQWRRQEFTLEVGGGGTPTGLGGMTPQKEGVGGPKERTIS